MYGAKDHTFVVCAYGESPYLESCVHSLMEQELPTNILISTSTPNDRIRNVADSFGIRLVANDGEPSISQDWNRAVAHCDTPLVTIAHQDDVYFPQYVESMLEMMNLVKRPLIFFSDYGELRNGEPCDSNRILEIKRRLLMPLRKTSASSRRYAKRAAIAFGSAICCPSVTYCRPNLPDPLFATTMKCDLDWEAWERFSRLEGSFIYAPQILMRHRIHEESETTSLIKDDTRSKEDLIMLKKFWPTPVAMLINRIYSGSQKSNDI